MGFTNSILAERDYLKEQMNKLQKENKELRKELRNIDDDLSELEDITHGKVNDIIHNMRKNIDKYIKNPKEGVSNGK